MHHTSGTYLLSLPVEYIRELGWKGKQKLSIELHGETLVIKDWKRKS